MQAPIRPRRGPARSPDYVSDVASVADQLPHNPVVIGHSLRGFVVQKYLESSDAPAGVLMASAPPQGALKPSLRMMRRHPWAGADDKYIR